MAVVCRGLFCPERGALESRRVTGNNIKKKIPMKSNCVVLSCIKPMD